MHRWRLTLAYHQFQTVSTVSVHGHQFVLGIEVLLYGRDGARLAGIEQDF